MTDEPALFPAHACPCTGTPPCWVCEVRPTPAGIVDQLAERMYPDSTEPPEMFRSREWHRPIYRPDAPEEWKP